MNVLGISAYFHDSSAAIVRDGMVVAAIAEDRLTHVKHDPNFPIFAIDTCLKQAGLDPADLDIVVFYEEPHVKFGRVLTLLLAEFPRGALHFARSLVPWLVTRLWLKTVIANRLGVDPQIVRFLPHHVSHAGQAFLASGYEEAAILTLDGVGEWTTTSIGRGSRAAPNGVDLLVSSDYPHSVGLAYAAVTSFLGFRPNDQECSTMALAAFGSPVHLDRFRAAMQVSEGRVRLEPEAFDFLGDTRSALSPVFADELGLTPRDEGDGYSFDIFAAEPGTASARDRAYADVAASLQARLTEIMLELANYAHALTGLDRLCLAGGVAYNAVSVGELMRRGPFREVFVPPDPGDAGGAAGAALVAAHRAGGRLARAAMPHPYLGTGGEAGDLGALVAELDVDEVPPPPVPIPGEMRVAARSERVGTSEALVSAVADELASARIVGWLQGRSEFGPRALGNRSILARPDDIALAQRIARTIKVRPAYRPFALSVAEEAARELFELPSAIQQPARWMQTVLPVRPGARDGVRGALHVDGTTRPQICAATDNPLFHALLTEVGRTTGLAALLNTSLNLSGLPLCAGAPEALVLFWSCDIDTLVIEDWILRKD